jgi:hypothetical protein
MIPSVRPVIGVENGATANRFSPPRLRGFCRVLGIML